MSYLRMLEKPDLRTPHVVVGFSGWANAGEVSSGTVSYLRSNLNTVKFAELEPDPFYDFTTVRPNTKITEGVIRQFAFVSNEFFYLQNPHDERDLVLFLGAEPHLRWKEYTNAFFSAFEQYKPTQLSLIGSYYDSTPHTHPSNVAAAVTDDSMKTVLEKHDVHFTDYQGPASIHSMVQQGCQERGLPSLSLWCSTPHYLPTANPKAWQEVLIRLLPILGIELDLEELRRRGKQLERNINQALLQNPKLHQYVRQLEQAVEAQQEQEPLKSDEIIKSLEEFLRKQQKEGT